ncbi:transposase [Candidatus Gracilibacteria bacterium]|nr:transposase [Candidatus Gracilibacteria bacterium]
MNKYIHDSIRNNLRSIISGCSVPQQKAITEVVRGLFTEGSPILRHLAQNQEVSAKKQGDKYAHHLGNVVLTKKVEKFALKRAKPEIKHDTIIAYDLSDISKECSRKMDKIARVWDGSKRKVTNGYTLHGVGINTMLCRLKIHNGDKYFQNQLRREIVTKIANKIDKKGVWVFDRGNDDKNFFRFLSSELKVRFIARLKENRQVVLKKTGVLIKVKNLKPGKYPIFLMNRYNQKPETSMEYVLVIKKHLDNDEPIRLISNLHYYRYSKNKIVTMYLERWGVENIFKHVKTKFGLESVRVLDYQKLLNLVALIQFATIISTLIFASLLQSTTALLSGLLLIYKRFLKVKSLNMNIDSFISFMKTALNPFVFRNHSPPNQQNLFSFPHLKKLGSF